MPDELYREVKSRAALQRRMIKDYVAEGLRLALEAEERTTLANTGPAAVFDEIRAQPQHTPAEIQDWMQTSQAERKAGWSDEH